MRSYDSARRIEKQLLTRAQIIEAAKFEFEEKGFREASIRSIALKCGVASGTVLTHFSTKQDLCHSALFDDLEKVCQEAIQAPTTGSLHHDYVAVAAKLYSYYADRPALSRELLRESLFAEDPWRQRFMQQVLDVNQALTAWAIEAMKERRLASEINPVLLASSFLSFYYFALIGWMQEGLPDPLPAVEAMLSQHLHGMTLSPETHD